MTPTYRACTFAGLVTAALTAACGGDVTATVVTIEARPAVRPLIRLDVTVANANATLTESLDVAGVSLPATFSVTTDGREGELEIAAVGRDVFGGEAARGRAVATIDPDGVAEAALLLEPTDFVVNTLVAGSQQMIFFDGNGARQVAAAPNGDFTIGFSDDCGELSRCDVWARSFNSSAVPLATEVAGSALQFNLKRSSDTFGNDPAMAVGPSGHRVAVWWAIDRVFCTSFDPAGKALTPLEVSLSTDGLAPQPPSIAAVGAGRYAVTWEENDNAGASIIRGMLIDDACAPQVNAVNGQAAAFPVSPAAPPTTSLEFPVVASDGQRMGFVWRNGSALHGRFSGNDGSFGASEIVVAAEDDAVLLGQHLVATEDGYLLAYVRNEDAASLDIRARRLSRGGAADSPESVLATGVQGEGITQPAPALARRSDGAIMATWYGCGFAVDPECSIVARVARATGLPVGDAFHVNTTVLGKQKDPSVAALLDAFAVAWTDGSGLPPDADGFGIRARVVYPAFDGAIGVIGAPCGADRPCNDALVCIAGSDQVAHCHAACDPEGPAPVCPAGGLCTTSGGVSGCVF